jgi:hypothetical protein
MTAPQNFVDGVGPVLSAAWLNRVDQATLLINATPQGNITLGPPASGITLTVLGLAGVPTSVFGTVAIGQNVGLATGDNVYSSSANGLNLGTTSPTAVRLYANSVLALTINSSGAVTIAAPVVGPGLLVNGAASNVTANFISSNLASGAFGVNIIGGTNSSDWALAVQNRAQTANFLKLNGDGSGYIGWNGSVQTLTFDSNGRMVINTPLAAGPSLNIHGIANVSGGFALTVSCPSVLSQSWGLQIVAGTNATDAALSVSNAALTTNPFTVWGDGGITAGPATGGTQGLGTMNVSFGYYVNGVLLSGALTTAGSFTGTLTGCTTAPSAVFNWTRVGNLVFVYCSAGLSATSNSVACTVTGSNMPSSGNSSAFQPPCFVIDNAVTQLGAAVQPNGGNLTFWKAAPGVGFTASGVKGIPANWAFSYVV